MDVRAAFNAIVGNLEYPMFIVTARAGDERLGCLVGFATQTSIDPPRFAVGLSHENRTHRRGRDSAALAVHGVPADAEDLAELFGGETARRGRQVRALRVARRARGRCRSSTAASAGSSVASCSASTRATTSSSSSSPIAASAGREDDFTFHRAKRIEPGHPA